MKTSVHLCFPGNCEEAFQFYEKCLGGEITLLLKYADSPLALETMVSLRSRVLHATLTIGATTIAGTDVPPADYEPLKGFSVLLDVEGVEEAQRVFQELGEGGTVQMPLQETFWAERFGTLTDRFGVPWEINCGQAETGQAETGQAENGQTGNGQTSI